MSCFPICLNIQDLRPAGSLDLCKNLLLLTVKKGLYCVGLSLTKCSEVQNNKSFKHTDLLFHRKEWMLATQQA